ncbi:type 2 lantipeptide synthetase LanM [Salipaludibacillus agaradhaerens]|uniref:Type 2 lantipeptide synthetase LanM n=1 Tax=Salipaludibacillus agaradhaerens TaxID=76935 RepID=A0A9Q4B367_SALAG|nr:type 2 lanthipeptide synthetase LanM family protein [Salipaludibacillus agaradhaerens]MCR6097295.1 type 2 lantipeptide synthetase LanM [Salipaludibacillus agaradhaerens]MCR6113220.1 type 2 lantipeptide synthetase LanM [Salipaludibacillus agaradhaerens]
MNNMLKILRCGEKKESGAVQDASLLDRNIDIVYKGDTQLVTESLHNVLSINSLERVRRLYNTDLHKYTFKLNVYQRIKQEIANQEIDPQERSEDILFHTFALKITSYFIKKLTASNRYQAAKHNLKDESQFLKDVSTQFQKQILKTSYRTLVLDLNINRENGKLQGNTKEEKYRYYNHILLNDSEYLNSFFDFYLGLLRIIANEIRKFKKFITELLTRYDHDKLEISATLSNQTQIEQIETIEVGLGDAHSDGRKVAQVILENSVLIYKPRNLNIDLLYEKIVVWLNEKIDGDQYQISTPKVISRKEYGWVEFIQYEECSDEQDIKNFYRRMGGQIALLYTLNAVDFHSENIIANGSFPVLVDLESLFHIPYEHLKTDTESAYVKAEKKLNSSVRTLGLLPFFFGRENVDISGIGRKGKVQSFIKLPQIKNPNKDDMKIEREYVSMDSSSNHPKWNGEFVYAQDYISEIKDGFAKVFETISSYSEEILKVINDFSDAVFVRFIPKPTVKYASFLELSLHPRFLHNAIDREVYLAKIWEEIKVNENYIPLAKHEYSDLINDDIPYFKLPIHSKDLFTSRNKVIADYFRHSPFELVRKKINGLSKEELDFQLEVIDLSMLASGDDRQRELKKFVTKNPEDYKKPFHSQQYFIKKAEEIAEHIYSQSFKGTNNGKPNYSWLNSTPVGVEEIQWNLVPMGDTMYDGLSGMAMTYLSLWIVTKKQKYLDIAIDIVEDISVRFKDLELSEERKTHISVGAFSGVSSIIYMLMNFYIATKEKKYKELSLELTDKITVLIEQDKEFDIIGGAAGAITVLISCYDWTRDDVFLKTAAQCSEHIMNNAVDINQNEISWIGVAEQPLTGYSHGNAGIIYSLSLLNNYLKDETISKVIMKGMNYENNQMIQDNWIDRRKPVEEAATSAWCHGSPGILLSRLGLAGSHENKISQQAESDMNMARDNIFYDGFGREHSLCHGDIGNAAILIAYGRETNQPDVVEMAQNLMLESLQIGEEKGYKCGVGREVETPNLMVGMAGIIYGALFACDERVPNILSLKLDKIE